MHVYDSWETVDETAEGSFLEFDRKLRGKWVIFQRERERERKDTDQSGLSEKKMIYQIEENGCRGKWLISHDSSCGATNKIL